MILVRSIAIIAVTLTACAGPLGPPPRPAAPDFRERSLSLKRGMSEQEVTSVLGKPTKADLPTCGSQTPRLRTCIKSLTYGEFPYSGIKADFSEDAAGEWRLNDWTVR
jgi:hypothetical protein